MRTYRVPALEKSIAILELLAQSDRALTATEIHLEVGVPKATAFMVLAVLERHQMVKKDAENRYTLGVKLYELGATYVSKLDVVEVGRPHLEALMAQTGLTSHMGSIYAQRTLFIDKIEPASFVRFSTFPGMRSDVHISSLGKAIAAFLDEADLVAIIETIGLGKYTDRSITTELGFREELQRVRILGYSVEDEEGELGIRCIGAPVFDNRGYVIAAVSVCGLVSQISELDYPRLGAVVRQMANTISRAMGATNDESRQSVSELASIGDSGT
ncbi:IclR family transcriptional regulator [soil metagenome]